ncbi:hypothetical protein AWW66_03240 [Micromonospora rosaria]|uniref:DUF418 domain-containing protein n=1 Tax=Micromonospora rosaria TaxID=47874 RepID=A0A136PXY5_9ACTN|nr:hypothetical protein [Micromonospora rosaria]KXK63341.1 hypothetical protein AWW66_03240 [Micromonospora rosaria]
MIRDAGTVLAAIGALACAYFVLTYQVTTGGDWRRSAAGRHLMQFTACLGILMGLIVAARLWPDYPGRDQVTLMTFGWLVGQVIWRSVLLHRAQHPHDQEPAGRR